MMWLNLLNFTPAMTEMAVEERLSSVLMVENEIRSGSKTETLNTTTANPQNDASQTIPSDSLTQEVSHTSSPLAQVKDGLNIPEDLPTPNKGNITLILSRYAYPLNIHILIKYLHLDIEMRNCRTI